MESRNISSIAMNFRQLLEDPVDTPVVDEEEVIFDMQEFNRRIVYSVRVAGTQVNDIERITIDKQRRVAELVTNEKIAEMIHNKKQGKNVTEGVVLDPPEQQEEFKQTRKFISSERNSNTTPEDFSERWSISVAQEKLTLKATTQRLKQSAVIPLSRKYRADRMFGVKLLDCIMATDTMHAKNKSIHGELYYQVFITKEFSVKVYPM